jgi:hypothetical protein
MPASTAGSRLSSLRCIDPQEEPGWRHVVVPAGSGQDRQARDVTYLGLHALLDTVDNHPQHPKEYPS